MTHNAKSEQSKLPMISGILAIVGLVISYTLVTLKQLSVGHYAQSSLGDMSGFESRYQAFVTVIDTYDFIFATFCLLAGAISFFRAKDHKASNFFAAMALAIGSVWYFYFFKMLIWKLLL